MSPPAPMRSAGDEDGDRWRRTLRLGRSLTVELSSADRCWSSVLDRRYRAFWDPVREAAGREAFRLELSASSSPPATPRLMRELSAHPVRSRSEDGMIRIEHPQFHSLIDWRRDRGCLTGPGHRFPVDAVLRHLLAMWPESVLLHGVLLAEEEQAWLGVGPSGSGKSTLAELLPERALCDELVLAVRDGGGWEARSTPFWWGRPGAGRLQGIHLLAHGDETRSESLAPERAWRRIASQVIWPDWSTEAQTGVFHRLADLVREIPVFELAFRPEPEVWPTIRGAA